MLLAGCASLSPSASPTPEPSPIPTATAAPTPAASAAACHDWRAWQDSTPSGPTLHVAGTCDLPTPGYAIALRRKAPQGINPRDLLLEKTVTPPSGPIAQVITPVEVRYEEQTDVKYDTVTILPDGVTLQVGTTG